MQNSFLKLYNRKLYISVLIKMAKKGTRVVVTLECTEARTSSEPRRSNGISRYTTEKNKRNTTERLELKKFNPHLNKMTIHKEIK
ncbi:50S Ribosomal protein L33 [Prochlorococcus marinus str. MIT 9515]|nr:50S Ribosomal protein L33 [Prochlorococcus marinus str. MIT 9515]